MDIKLFHSPAKQLEMDTSTWIRAPSIGLIAPNHSAADFAINAAAAAAAAAVDAVVDAAVLSLWKSSFFPPLGTEWNHNWRFR